MGEKNSAMANRVLWLRFCGWLPCEGLGLALLSRESDAALRADAMRGIISEPEPKLVLEEAPLVAKLMPLLQHALLLLPSAPPSTQVSM